MMRILRAEECDRAQLQNPGIQLGNALEEAVDTIITQVRQRGDEALYEYARRFDGASLSSLQVQSEEIENAWAAADGEFKALLTGAAENIRSFHSHQLRSGFIEEKPGMVLGQRVIPLERVGLYVPGGTACYPSSVLMNAIPPLIAGVGQLIMATPPCRDGKVPTAILCAARAAGIRTIFKMGGAQAVAALAYGTASVPRVDKIVGPGNAYVATAKRKVYGVVDIDMVAGPSEILVVADAKSDPACLAADLLSQAEHDPMASAVLITPSERLALAVQAQVEKQLEALPRREIARSSIVQNGKIILVEDLNQAVAIANRFAPEHLELCVDDPFALLGAVKNAGSVFLGRNAPEALGDYWAGLNHTLPTSGTARFSSPLTVDDFVKTSQFVYYTNAALREAAPRVQAFARREGLEGHARSIGARLKEVPG